jgi:Ca2+-binding EF-hand superfamily protein
MNTVSKILSIAVALVAASTFAGPGPGRPGSTNNVPPIGSHTNVPPAKSQLGPLGHYDADNDGTVTKAEFAAEVADHVQRGLTNFLAHFDADTNGSVSAAEVTKVAQTAAEHWLNDTLARFDRNKDGSISTNELPRRGPNTDGPALTDLDIDKNGVISKAELVLGAAALAEEHADDVLGKFDTNKDGTITSDEIKAVLQAEEERELADILSTFDANKDGNVTAAEVAAVRSTQAQPPAGRPVPVPGAAPKPGRH